ncbi:hypothetical protein AK812_SmicGene5017 [Symbiodinium microadriaticum]|uniref:Uncharacterized protein n=1 Tax=Symbiodinium microadriaticum TaxID=2951 RepID=A0A1Q9EUV1_SYMMI|nr:hypothetical protein AK812_SmicGene5017 [Symbiodinium microadriaticum]
MLLLGTSACASCCRWATSGFGLQLANIDQHFWELLTHAKEPQGIIPFQGGQCFSEDVRGLGIGLDILQLDVVFIKHFSDGNSFLQEPMYTGDVKKLWQLLLAEPHRKYIVLRDIDPAAAAAYFRGDDKALTLYGTQSGPQASPSKWAGKISVINTEENEEAEVSPAATDSPSTPPSPSKGGTLALPGTPSKRRPASHASSRAASNASVARSQSGLGDEETPVYRPTRIAIWSEELGARKRAPMLGPSAVGQHSLEFANFSV